MNVTTHRSGSTSRKPTWWPRRTWETVNRSVFEKVITPFPWTSADMSWNGYSSCGTVLGMRRVDGL